MNIGAVDFLSYLRRDIDPSLYQDIDNVLTNLLSLPVVHDADDDQLEYDRSKQTNQFDLNIKSTGTSVEPNPNQPGVEIRHATEEHSTSVQKLGNEVQIISSEEEWHAGEGIDDFQCKPSWLIFC